MQHNFNLLVVFDAIYDSGSVSVAAKRLSLSQPAVSHALNRLRDVLNDPLFLRGGRKLVPTARATNLAQRVHALVIEARSVLDPMDFQPEQSNRRFVIAASDYAALTVAPALLAVVQRTAPNVTIHFENVGKNTLQELENGDIDLSFWGAQNPGSPWHWQELFQEDHVGLVASDHALVEIIAAGQLSVQDYLAHSHSTVSFHTPGGNRVDAALRALGLSRKVAVSTHSFAAVIQGLVGTDFIATMPRRLVRAFDSNKHISFPLPFHVPPYAYGYVWHARADLDPGLCWMRVLLEEQISSARMPTHP